MTPSYFVVLFVLKPHRCTDPAAVFLHRQCAVSSRLQPLSQFSTYRENRSVIPLDHYCTLEWFSTARQKQDGRLVPWRAGHDGRRPIPERPVGELTETGAAMETSAVPRCDLPTPHSSGTIQTGGVREASSWCWHKICHKHSQSNYAKLWNGCYCSLWFPW